MTSINSEKTLEYRNIQESLRYQNLTENILCKGIFLYVFSTLKDIMQAQSKTNPWIIQNIIIISLRAFQRNAFRSILMSMIA